MCQDFLVVPVSLIAAAGSQMTTALAAAKYNKTLLTKVGGGVIMLISGSIFPTYSLYCTFERILQSKFRRKSKIQVIEKQLEVVRSSLLASISKRQEIFKSSLSNYEALAENLSSLRNQSVDESEDPIQAEERRLLAYIQLMGPNLLKGNQEEQLPLSPSLLSKWRSGLDLAARVSGYALAAVFQAELASYTYFQTKEEVIDSPLLAASTASLTVIGNVYLITQAISGSMRLIAAKAAELFSSKANPLSLAIQLRPRTMILSQSLILANTLFAMGPSLRIWPDFFEFNQEVQIAGTSVVCTSLSFLLLTASLGTLQNMATAYLSSYGSEAEKEIFAIDGEFEKLKALFATLSPKDLAKLVNRLPEPLKDTLLSEARIGENELTDFISSGNDSSNDRSKQFEEGISHPLQSATGSSPYSTISDGIIPINI